jgi:hypothetical protein
MAKRIVNAHTMILLHGPVRTQFDMSRKEIAAIEKKYGCKVLFDSDKAKIKRAPIDSRIADNFFDHARRRKMRQELIEAGKYVPIQLSA